MALCPSEDKWVNVQDIQSETTVEEAKSDWLTKLVDELLDPVSHLGRFEDYKEAVIKRMRREPTIKAMEGIDDPAAARVILDEPQTEHAADMREMLDRVQCYCPVDVQDQIRALIKKAGG